MHDRERMMKPIEPLQYWRTELRDDIAILIFDCPGKKQNVLSTDAMIQLAEASLSNAVTGPAETILTKNLESAVALMVSVLAGRLNRS